MLLLLQCLSDYTRAIQRKLESVNTGRAVLQTVKQISMIEDNLGHRVNMANDAVHHSEISQVMAKDVE